MVLETGRTQGLGGWDVPLAPVPVSVGRATVTLLVRPDTLDADIVREVVATYRIPDLVESCRSKSAVTIFDIGAHIGAFSVIMATLVPRAVVRAFEPAPDNFAVLEQNIRHAGLTGRVTATLAGVGGRSGFLAAGDIGRSPDGRNTGGHSVVGTRVHVAAPADGGASVPLMPLGPLLDRETSVDILKIDCEGSEFEILYGLTPEQVARIETMVGEIHSCHGFAGSTTGGMAWNARALKAYLGRRFDSITTSHHIESETADLETFYATSHRRRPQRGLQLLRRLAGRVRSET